MPKKRIDSLLVELGLAESRNKAQALIMSGVVLCDERRVEKPAEMIEPNAAIRLKDHSAASRYVGRGGLKLEAALREFDIDVNGLACLDVGSSTGGFTDCLLQNGAARVVCIDSGTNQIAWKLRTDARVTVRERTNARGLRPDDFETLFGLIVMDVSFISVRKIIPALVPLLNAGGRVVVLIKPQFEVGRAEVGKGGVVRDEKLQQRVVNEINDFASGCGLTCVGLIESPFLGGDGNREFLALYRPP